MKKAKKFVAWLLGTVMILGTSTTAFAAQAVIEKQPQDAVSAENAMAVFEVAVQPSEGVSYQWQQGVPQMQEAEAVQYIWTDILGADGPAYEHTVTAEDLTGIVYRCAVRIGEEIIYTDCVKISDARIPKITGTTENGIQFERLETNEFVLECSVQGQENWTSSGNMEGLEPGQSYMVIGRLRFGDGTVTAPGPAVEAATLGETITEPEEPAEPEEPVTDPEEPAEPEEPVTDPEEPAEPAKPLIPELIATDSTSITVKAVEGQEYAIYTGDALPEDAEWKQGNGTITFENLTPETEYTIVSRIAATETEPAGEPGEVLTVVTEPEAQIPPAAPDTPELKARTTDTIEVYTKEGQEYALCEGTPAEDQAWNWQAEGVFTGLKPGTEYTIVTRIAGTEETLPGEISDPLTVSTEKPAAKAPEAPKLKWRSQTVLEVEAIKGQEYSIDGGTTWKTDGKFLDLKAGTEYEIVTRVAETETTGASEISPPLKASTLREIIKTSADENQIKGIKAGQIIKVGKEITFTATGGGMNITDPLEGDVRYVPIKWRGLGEGVWKNAPYTAAVKAEKAGNYILEVVFERQVYKDGKWTADGTVDVKSVKFKATVTGTDESVPKTGDETAPYLYLILLAAAAAAGIGAGAVRRHRR